MRKFYIPKPLETRPKFALVYGAPQFGARLVSRKKIRNIPKSTGLWYIPKPLETRPKFALVYGAPQFGARLVSRKKN